MNTAVFPLWILFLAIIAKEISARVEFTNIKCDSLDKSFADIEYCYIKAINRSYKYVSLKVNLLKPPVTQAKVNLSLMKRFSGYKPFLYNVTFDGCRYMKNPKSNPVAQYLGGLFLPFSNFNHKCPFIDDMIVDKLPIEYMNNQFTNVLPFPNGDYAVYSSWFVFGVNRVTVNVYFTLS